MSNCAHNPFGLQSYTKYLEKVIKRGKIIRVKIFGKDLTLYILLINSDL